MNPIENLWYFLKIKVNERGLKNMKDLEKLLKKNGIKYQKYSVKDFFVHFQKKLKNFLNLKEEIQCIKINCLIYFFHFKIFFHNMYFF
ncbi:hypothetical protein HERIO_2317 [Hepatospora eriocheir]|uniref:Uncharacterized protein n=1 Tax=Hepatospora eriocheir TaxID=1081669 RepID=A0A1X0Q7E3_9MICR|nr:hypothetical protein HERIO_2317 [Hepatospora eriocheir]